MGKKQATGLALVLSTLAIGCNPRADDDASAVSLAITGFKAGQDQGGEISRGDDIVGMASDVVSSSGVPSFDSIFVVVESLPKAPSGEPSDFYTVNLHTYTVRFQRLDGRNVEGVDIPFTQTLPTAGSVTPGDSADVELIVLTPRMKSEPPLRDLWFGTGQGIEMRMIITVFGRDLVGNDVSATSALVVFFDDFAG